MKNIFVHLRLHSTYSLAEGAIKTSKLISLCQEQNMPAVSITDTNNLFGALEFSEQLSLNGIQHIIGCQLNIQHIKKLDSPTSVLLYVQNEAGYHNLIQLVSKSYLNPTSDKHPEVSLDMLTNHSNGLILATGGIYGSLGALLLEDDSARAKEYLQLLQKYFKDRLYIEISRHNNAREYQIENAAISMGYDLNIPIVATNNICFSSKDDFNSHDALICIAQGKTIYDTDRQESNSEFHFKSTAEMIELFQDIPEAIENTVKIAQKCTFILTNKKPIMPQFKTQNGRTQEEELRNIVITGMEKRLQAFANKEDLVNIRKKYFERMEYELEMIERMGFSGYFLIVSDYVKWAKSKNIPVGPGRGSGAGSIVAWASDITDVDPIRFQLFFERFLNPDRVSMPDFDIDFCQERRDEVIKYVQQKYGYESVAQIITFGKLQAKAVVKDIGRVLAISYGFTDKISKMIPFHPSNPMTLQQAIDSEVQLKELINNDPQVKNLMEIALRLEGLYRHASVHAAGVVISDKILLDLVPLYKDHRSIMPVTQFSMKYIENAGLIKFDFLGLKTLTVIQKTIDFVKKRGVYFQVNEIPLNDEKTFNLLRNVNCVGVFQIESTGMREVLKKMQPDRVEDLIALVALYRPGPMDDIPKYISCKHGIEPIRYLDEKLKPILEETYGVMVYQEQVMQIAQIIGGYTLGQADILRRAMGKKNKEEMLAQKKRFIDGALKNGVDLEIGEQLFEQMNKFAGYGFNKSHATPYGLLTYQTAYLKANYMIEFFAAVMTLDITNTDKLFVSYQDAKKNNIKISPPDINFSEHNFTVNYENNSIRYSLTAIKGSGEHAVKEIVAERNKNGKYSSIFDFVERLSPLKIISKRILENFIKAGVFDILHPNRHQLFESMDQILSLKLSTDQASLFEKVYPKFTEVHEWNYTEKLQNEFAAIGFYISEHPVQQYEPLLKELRFPTLSEVQNLEKSKIVVIINSITYKTTKNQQKFCILQISDWSCTVEASMFSEALSQYRDLLEVGNIVVINVNCSKNNDQVRITIEKMEKFDNNYSPSFAYHIDDKLSSKKQIIKTQNQILHISIKTFEEIKAIKGLIDHFKQNGNIQIEFIFEDGKKILLPDRYTITSYDILDLRNIVGVSNVIIEHI